jgi:hypothetical protein
MHRRLGGLCTHAARSHARRPRDRTLTHLRPVALAQPVHTLVFGARPSNHGQVGSEIAWTVRWSGADIDCIYMCMYTVGSCMSRRRERRASRVQTATRSSQALFNREQTKQERGVMLLVEPATNLERLIGLEAAGQNSSWWHPDVGSTASGTGRRDRRRCCTRSTRRWCPHATSRSSRAGTWRSPPAGGRRWLEVEEEVVVACPWRGRERGSHAVGADAARRGRDASPQQRGGPWLAG